jgi:hypothetical protein
MIGELGENWEGWEGGGCRKVLRAHTLQDAINILHYAGWCHELTLQDDIMI